jgi:NAD(P)-dependent dehydrogenase (short-subunit alcohol dehydrogenase family)
VSGPGAVVTGAARGIGLAIAERLVREGHRVVANDVDASALQEASERVGMVPVPGDCASADGVRALLASAREHLGRIDVYVANAGVDVGTGLDTDDATWASALEVNVMAHVRAARELVPGWLEDGGGGRFVATASAAGLLTMVGNAPYAVSKHAAVAFAEWLSATYRDRGVVVQVVCPQGVRTRMTEDVGPLQPLLAGPDALEPQDVADALWEAMQDDRFLVLPHPEVRDHYRARVEDTDRWLAGMNRLALRLGVPRAGDAAADLT